MTKAIGTTINLFQLDQTNIAERAFAFYTNRDNFEPQSDKNSMQIL